MNTAEKYLASKKFLRDFVAWEKTHKNDPYVNWEGLIDAIETLLGGGAAVTEVPKVNADGVIPGLPPDEPEPDYKALYYSLIYAVCRKFEGETRFDTALRYIREVEGAKPMLSLQRKEDGIWLMVEAGSKHAAIPLNFRSDGIVHAALSAACEIEADKTAPKSDTKQSN